VVNPTPGRCTRGKDPVPIVRTGGWVGLRAGLNRELSRPTQIIVGVA